jgi:phosphatidylserine decarboxylase
VSAIRRTLLAVLPKLALSRATGLCTHTPLPRVLRRPVYGWFARRYGVDLTEVPAALESFASLAVFFQRPLRDGARPIDEAPVVWPCDGRVVTSGPLRDDRLEQIKGHDYGLAELVVDAELARGLRGGSQATVYLAPGDYHRVHAPFGGRLVADRHVPGALFPVNPGAVRAIRGLFVRNERVVFRCELPDGRPAAVVMIAALNVGDIVRVLRPPTPLSIGDEIGRFGFGSTTVVLLPPGGPVIAPVAPETAVRTGRAVPLLA